MTKDYSQWQPKNLDEALGALESSREIRREYAEAARKRNRELAEVCGRLRRLELAVSAAAGRLEYLDVDSNKTADDLDAVAKALREAIREDRP